MGKIWPTKDRKERRDRGQTAENRLPLSCSFVLSCGKSFFQGMVGGSFQAVEFRKCYHAPKARQEPFGRNSVHSVKNSFAISAPFRG